MIFINLGTAARRVAPNSYDAEVYMSFVDSDDPDQEVMESVGQRTVAMNIPSRELAEETALNWVRTNLVPHFNKLPPAKP